MSSIIKISTYSTTITLTARVSALMIALFLLSISTIHAAEGNPFEQTAIRSFSGLFRSSNVRMRLQPAAGGLLGSLEFNGQTNTVKGELIEGRLEGVFSLGSTNWPFTMTMEAGGAVFKAGQFTTRLQKAVLPKISGAYRGAMVSLKIEPKDDGYAGTVQLQGKDLPFTAKDLGGELAGTCGTGDQGVPFTLVFEEGKLMFHSGRSFAEALQPVEVVTGRPSGGSGATAFENSLGMKFVVVPGTKVLFCIWETRVQDYKAFVEATDFKWESPSFDQGPTHPAVEVSWDDAKLFCTWLTKTERKTGRLQPGQYYRLPTDAEWSFAVGIGGRESGSTPKEKDGAIKDVYPWGSQWPPPEGAGNFADMTAKLKNRDMKVIDGYDDDFANTSPVGSFKANPLGIYDLSGNVWDGVRIGTMANRHSVCCAARRITMTLPVAYCPRAVTTALPVVVAAISVIGWCWMGCLPGRLVSA